MFVFDNSMKNRNGLIHLAKQSMKYLIKYEKCPSCKKPIKACVTHDDYGGSSRLKVWCSVCDGMRVEIIVTSPRWIDGTVKNMVSEVSGLFNFMHQRNVARRLMDE